MIYAKDQVLYENSSVGWVEATKTNKHSINVGLADYSTL